MGNKRFINSEEEAKLDFLNERVIDNKKNRVTRLLILAPVLTLALLAVLFVLCVIFKHGFSLAFFKKGFDKESIKASVEGLRESLTTQKTEEETTDISPENETVIEELKPEELREYSICSLELADSYNEEIESKNTFLGTGVVINVESGIDILTYYENISKYEKVNVEFSNGMKYSGKIKRISEDYGLALINIDENELDKEALNNIKAVNISKENQHKIGKELNYIGNSSAKNTIIKNNRG